jgi:hypothetical protein
MTEEEDVKRLGAQRQADLEAVEAYLRRIERKADIMRLDAKSGGSARDRSIAQDMSEIIALASRTRVLVGRLTGGTWRAS